MIIHIRYGLHVVVKHFRVTSLESVLYFHVHFVREILEATQSELVNRVEVWVLSIFSSNRCDSLSSSCLFSFLLLHLVDPLEGGCFDITNFIDICCHMLTVVLVKIFAKELLNSVFTIRINLVKVCSLVSHSTLLYFFWGHLRLLGLNILGLRVVRKLLHQHLSLLFESLTLSCEFLSLPSIISLSHITITHFVHRNLYVLSVYADSLHFWLWLWCILRRFWGGFWFIIVVVCRASEEGVSESDVTILVNTKCRFVSVIALWCSLHIWIINWCSCCRNRFLSWFWHWHSVLNIFHKFLLLHSVKVGAIKYIYVNSHAKFVR